MYIVSDESARFAEKSVTLKCKLKLYNIYSNWNEHLSQKNPEIKAETILGHFKRLQIRAQLGVRARLSQWGQGIG